MELIIEILFELIFEGALEISKNRKLSKWIRYPSIFLIILLFVFVITLIGWLAIIMYKENIIVSILLLVIDIVFIVALIFKVRKYKEKYKNDK